MYDLILTLIVNNGSKPDSIMLDNDITAADETSQPPEKQ